MSWSLFEGAAAHSADRSIYSQAWAEMDAQRKKTCPVCGKRYEGKRSVCSDRCKRAQILRSAK